MKLTILIYRPRENERLSWPCWLTYSGRFTHIKWLPISCSSGADHWKLETRETDVLPLSHSTQLSRMAGPVTTSAFNQLCQYASSPGTGPLLRRTRRFFPSGDLRPPSVLIVPNHGGMARLSRPGWLWLNDGVPANGHPSQYKPGRCCSRFCRSCSFNVYDTYCLGKNS